MGARYPVDAMALAAARDEIAAAHEALTAAGVPERLNGALLLLRTRIDMLAERGTAPPPASHADLRRHVAALKDEGLSFESAHAYQEARQVLADAAEALLDEIDQLRGTAPQVPAEWEGQTEPMPTDETPAHSNLYRLPFTPGTYVRVVAADGAPPAAKDAD